MRLAENSAPIVGEYGENNTIVKFLYEPIQTKLIVKYVDQDGKELASPKETNSTWGSSYTTEPIKIAGYELTELPLNQKGTFTEELIEVVYQYKSITSTVIVHHRLEDASDFSPSVVLTGQQGEHYQTQAVRFDQHMVIKAIGDLTGSYLESEQEVIYVYTKILPPVIFESTIGASIVQGTGIANSEVIVTFPNGMFRSTKVDAQGKWQVAVPTRLILEVGDLITAITYDDYTEFKSIEAIAVVKGLTEPTEPTEPNEPTEPTEPTEPNEPTEPTEPTESNEPTEPTEPAEPWTPAKPKLVSTSANNSGVKQVKNYLPRTGEETNLLLTIVGISGLMAILIIIMNRKRTNSKN